MNCKSPYYTSGHYVPCGQCAACRLARSGDWAIRLSHENAYWEKSAFVTLTYDDEHLPNDGRVDKPELVRAIKRLRHYLGNRRISYYGCGEYGDLNHRPHYHLIIFGIGTGGSDRKAMLDAWDKCDPNRLTMQTVTSDRCQYVAAYVMKKWIGKNMPDGYFQPFCIMSKGLGARWAFDNINYLQQNMKVHVKAAVKQVPRYYLKKLNMCPAFLAIHGMMVRQETEIKIRERHGDILFMNEGVKASRIQHNKNLEAKGELRKRQL